MEVVKTEVPPLELVIVRGLPGAGKSTFAASRRMLFPDSHGFVVEADQYFLVGNTYVFNRYMLRSAHEWCHAKTMQYLRQGFSVVVANTFTTVSELEPYVLLKVAFPNITLSVVEVKSQFESVHDVPAETIEKMRNRWQEIPDDWPTKYNFQVHTVKEKTS